MKLIDVHTHLTHAKFQSSIDDLLKEVDEKMYAVICNGLEPVSNRQILEFSKNHPTIKAALGIYPIDAICSILPDDFTLKVTKFDVDEEIKFISQMAEEKRLIAIGECGLDHYWITGEQYQKLQEYVFENLIEIAKRNDLPVIVHSRKAEKRTAEILAHHQIKKVDFHCFGGRTKLASRLAENEDWCFSIPANVRRNQAFAKMLKILPKEKILTETDAPYLSPVPGNTNSPLNVQETIIFWSEIRKEDPARTSELIYNNYQRLFNAE